MVAAGAVGQNVTRMDFVALAHDRLVVDAAALVGTLELRNQVLVELAFIILDDDGRAVDVVDHARVLGNEHFARVNRDAMLDAGADVRRVGLQQRHSLTLHVRTHEGAVCVVVLQERNERGSDRSHLTRRHVHVADTLGSDFLGLAEDAVGVTGAAQNLFRRHEHAIDGLAEHARLGVELLHRLSDGVVLFLVGGEVVDLVGYLAVDNATVRSLDEAIAVHASEGRQRADKADVRAFRRLDGAHAAVVRIVNVANLEACALARQTARAQSRQTTLVRDACGGVCLVHELRQLRRAKEFLDGSHNGANVHEALRSDFVRLLHAHALAHNALHARKADAELVLDELADRADTTVAEVVDVVDLIALFALVKGNDVAHGCDDVFNGERRSVEFGIEAELLVRLVAADLGEVVALRVEEQAVEQRARRVNRRRLARTETLVQLDERLFLGGRGVAIERAQNHLGAAEDIDDLFAGVGDAEGAQKQRGRLLALAVDANRQNVALVGLKLEPCATRRNNLRAVDGLVGRLVALGAEIDAGRTNELGNHNALGAVNNERATRGHEREIAHEQVVLIFDFAGLAVDETNLGIEGRLVGDVFLFAFVDGVLRLAEVMLAELDAHIFGRVLDGAHVVEGFGNAFFHEPLETVGLDGDEVGDIDDARDLRERMTLPVYAGAGLFCLGHRSSFLWGKKTIFLPFRLPFGHAFTANYANEKFKHIEKLSQDFFSRTVLSFWF